MKTYMPFRSGFFAASLILTLCAASNSANAQVLSTPNIFTGSTATGNANYGTAGNVVDGTNQVFVFAPNSPAPADNILNISNFSALDGIDSLKIYTGSGSLRTPSSVTIYYSSANSTSLSIDPANYTQLGDGAFTLSFTGTTQYLSEGNSSPFSSPITFATLSNLSIPSDTQSLIFQFGSGPLGDQFGTQIDEIQGFAAAPAETPEPSTWAMMLAGLAALGFVARRRLNA